MPYIVDKTAVPPGEPDEIDALDWHALNYRTAHFRTAHEMWLKLEDYVARQLAAERERHTDLADAARVLAWAREKPRRPANTAFTAGAERQAAYWIEWAEAEERERCAKLAEDFDPTGEAQGSFELLADDIRAGRPALQSR